MKIDPTISNQLFSSYSARDKHINRRLAQYAENHSVMGRIFVPAVYLPKTLLSVVVGILCAVEPLFKGLYNTISGEDWKKGMRQLFHDTTVHVSVSVARAVLLPIQLMRLVYNPANIAPKQDGQDLSFMNTII